MGAELARSGTARRLMSLLGGSKKEHQRGNRGGGCVRLPRALYAIVKTWTLRRFP